MEGGRGRGLFDASSCMLVEASGDSEADNFDATVEAELDATAAEDDAQSCSCGWLADGAAVHEVDAGGDDFRGADFDDCIEEEEDGGGGASEVEDGVVDQCCGGGEAAEELNNSKACEDSNMKLMNEGETDRLFWEACLAS